MTDTTIITRRGSGSVNPMTVLDKPVLSTAPAGRKPAPLPRWLGFLLGRLATRACPSARNIESCEGCHLRALCKCAHENFRAAVALEQKVWAALALCAGATILYAAYSYLYRG